MALSVQQWTGWRIHFGLHLWENSPFQTESHKSTNNHWRVQSKEKPPKHNTWKKSCQALHRKPAGILFLPSLQQFHILKNAGPLFCIIIFSRVRVNKTLRGQKFKLAKWIYCQDSVSTSFNYNRNVESKWFQLLVHKWFAPELIWCCRTKGFNFDSYMVCLCQFVFYLP